MCKLYNKAVDNVLDALRLDGCKEIRRIYDSANPVNLVGLFTVNSRDEGNFWDVGHDADVHVSDYFPYYGGWGRRMCAVAWGDPYARVEKVRL